MKIEKAPIRSKHGSKKITHKISAVVKETKKNQFTGLSLKVVEIANKWLGIIDSWQLG
jgi:hypothetical protein